MIEIYKYSPDIKSLWDNFINNSRNGTFLFLRDYMDYHSDRYNDCSFIFMKKGEIIAVVPGNIDGHVYYSHQGLTYGGIISSFNVKISDIGEIFNFLNKRLKELGIKEVIYKPVPFIYHQSPSQEDLYLLFRIGARKTGCNISSVICKTPEIEFSQLRKRGIRRGLREGVIISGSDKYDLFWQILNENLDRKHKSKPVHSIDEIILLKNRFPANIKLFMAYVKNQPVAGVVVYIMPKVVRVQYISSNEDGKKAGALDFLFDELINNVFSSVPYFDLGTSNENGGHYLNEKLVFQKEGFGGRGVVYEIYSYNI